MYLIWSSIWMCGATLWNPARWDWHLACRKDCLCWSEECWVSCKLFSRSDSSLPYRASPPQFRSFPIYQLASPARAGYSWSRQWCSQHTPIPYQLWACTAWLHFLPKLIRSLARCSGSATWKLNILKIYSKSAETLSKTDTPSYRVRPTHYRQEDSCISCSVFKKQEFGKRKCWSFRQNWDQLPLVPPP